MFKVGYFALMGFVVLAVNMKEIRKEITEDEWKELSECVSFINFEKVSDGESDAFCKFFLRILPSHDTVESLNKLIMSGVVTKNQVWKFTKEQQNLLCLGSSSCGVEGYFIRYEDRENFNVNNFLRNNGYSIKEGAFGWGSIYESGNVDIVSERGNNDKKCLCF